MDTGATRTLHTINRLIAVMRFMPAMRNVRHLHRCDKSLLKEKRHVSEQIVISVFLRTLAMCSDTLLKHIKSHICKVPSFTMI